MRAKKAPWPRPTSGYTPERLLGQLTAVREQLNALVARLPEAGWLGPRAEHLNPPLWEYGHIVWFQERWCLRWREGDGFAAGQIADGDRLFDSATVPHDTRWSLPLPNPAQAREYGERVLAAVGRRLSEDDGHPLAYFAELALYHELMHIEAWWMAWQSLGYAPPHVVHVPENLPREPARIAFAAGTVHLGSAPDSGFVFDNEKWSHEVATRGFDIDATPVTEGAYAAFLAEDGYARPEFWSAAGQGWLAQSGARAPLYWRAAPGGWEVRRFQHWEPLVDGRPMLHLNRYEAEAYAAFRSRRLPTAAEWRRAADAPGFHTGAGWEWLDETFAPYPGFEPDPYTTYSQPWFNTHVELRGGSPVSAPALARPGYRNFYLPHRRDPFTACRTAGDARDQ